MTARPAVLRTRMRMPPSWWSVTVPDRDPGAEHGIGYFLQFSAPRRYGFSAAHASMNSGHTAEDAERRGVDRRGRRERRGQQGAYRSTIQPRELLLPVVLCVLCVL